VVAFLPHSPLRDMLDKSPRLANVFWRETFVEAAIFREWVTNLGRRDAVARVAHVVCELAMRLQLPPAGAAQFCVYLGNNRYAQTSSKSEKGSPC
jgi:CRP-like cAMP-binding protein